MMQNMSSLSASNGHPFSPVDDVREILYGAGRIYFQPENAYENCLCALVLAFEPGCKTHRFLDALPQHDRPMDEIDLLNVMAHIGYFGRHIKASPADIDPRLLPCLAVQPQGQPYVLIEDRAGYDHLPPYIKTAKSAGPDKADIWIFQPYDENKKSTSKFMRAGTGASWFQALTGRFRGTIAQILTANLILNLIALITPLFIMIVYDRVIAANALNTLPMLATGVFIAIAFEWRLRKIRSRGLSWLAGRMDNIIGNKIFTHLLGLSPSLIERASVPAQVARIKTFEALRDFFSGSVFLSLIELPFVAIAALVILAVAGKLVFVPLAVAGLYLCIFFAVRHRVKTVIRLAAKATSARQSFMIESFEKIDAVRSSGLSKKWMARFRLLSGQEMYMHFNLNWLGMVAETLGHALTLVAAVATVGFGVSMVWAGSLSTGGLVASMILVWRVLTPFYSLCTMIPRLEQIRNSIGQVNQLMDIDTEATEAKSASRLPWVRGGVEFSNVTFRYKDEAVFHNANFRIDPASTVVITGENGSGKSTILKLIKAMVTADEGAVRIDGFDVRQLDAPELRRQIAYVSQTPQFIDGTIIENLRCVNPLATDIEIEQALKRADAYEDVRELEKGLETVIDNAADEIVSASLKTRLSLARGYLHPSSVLLIDELPNTITGSAAGYNLKKYLKECKGQKTFILVSYREDFISLADQVIRVRKGFAPHALQPENMIEQLYEKDVA